MQIPFRSGISLPHCSYIIAHNSEFVKGFCKIFSSFFVVILHKILHSFLYTMHNGFSREGIEQSRERLMQSYDGIGQTAQ